jgi:hypothetical protein
MIRDVDDMYDPSPNVARRSVLLGATGDDPQMTIAIEIVNNLNRALGQAMLLTADSPYLKPLQYVLGSMAAQHPEAERVYDVFGDYIVRITEPK